jgi:hypothetical protein
MTKKNLSIEESIAFKEHWMLDCFKIIIENANATVLFTVTVKIIRPLNKKIFLPLYFDNDMSENGLVFFIS